MIRIKVTKTAKGYAPADRWYQYGIDSVYFPNLEEAMIWLKKEYGNHRRSKMYVDRDGGAKHIGYVIGFRVPRDFHECGDPALMEQHWLHFSTIEDLILS